MKKQCRSLFSYKVVWKIFVPDLFVDEKRESLVASLSYIYISFLGSLLKIKNEPLHIFFHKLAQNYGDFSSIRLGERLIINLSDIDLVKKVFNLNQVTGRPDLSIFEITKNGASGISMCDTSPVYQKNRKIVVTAIRQFHLHPSNKVVLHKEAQKMINAITEIADSDKSFHISEFFHTAVASYILHAMFGFNIDYKNENFNCFIAANRKWFEAAEANDLADFFSFMKYFPNKKLENVQTCTREYASFLKRYIEESDEEPKGMYKTLKELFDKNYEESDCHKEHELFRTVADVVGGGFDTTAATLSWAVLYLCKNKDVYQKCQEELRSFTNSPFISSGDEKKLPYYKATIYEIFRHSSVAPLGLPHSAVENLEINGYKIPKGTVIFANISSVNRKPKQWNDPCKFNPNNFLNENGQFDIGVIKSLATFSHGKRVCPGENIALNQVIVKLSALILGYDFELDTPPVDMLPKGGLTSLPKTYTVKITRAR